MTRSRSDLPPGSPHRHWHRSVVRKLLSYAFVFLMLAFALLPCWQVVVMALDSSGEMATENPFALPERPGWENLQRLLTETDFLRWSLNSAFVALVVTLTSLVLSSTAGYALSRFRFFGHKALLQSLLVTQIFPATMLLLPLYLLLIRLQLINTFLGLILIYSATVLPFCIWQMKSFYDRIPETLEEAARLEGCGHWQVFSRVMLPVSAPGLAITALFSFAAAWNEYVVAAIIMQDSPVFTLPLGLRLLHAGDPGWQWGVFAVGALLAAVPVLAFYLLLSRFLSMRIDDISVRPS